MTAKCGKCGSAASPAYNFCTKCGAPLRLATPCVGKTVPMAVRTQAIPASPWPAPAFPEALTAVQGAELAQGGYVTTGVAGPEAEVIVADRSGSMGEEGLRTSKMDDLKVAIRTHVLQKMHIDRQDRVALVSFAHKARVDCAWAILEDPSKLLAAIDALNLNGGTCFKSGLRKAEGLFATLPLTSGTPALKKIIFFTDGQNNEGDPVPAAERLKNAGVIIQAVGFGRSEKDMDEGTLRCLVSVIDQKEQYWFCRDAQELTRTFKALSSKTRVFRP